MYYYKVAEIYIKSDYRLPSFEAFSCDENKEDIPDSGCIPQRTGKL